MDKINRLFQKTTPEQRKIIQMSAIGFIFLFSLLILICVPQTRKLARIKRQLNDTENQIAQITLLTQGKDLAVIMQEMKAGLIKNTNKLPQTEDIVISTLLDTAKKLKVEVKSITPASHRELNDVVNGYIIKELPISMAINCDVKMLGEYLNTLKDSPDILIRVRRINIQGKGEGEPQLDVSLAIAAYLSKKK